MNSEVSLLSIKMSAATIAAEMCQGMDNPDPIIVAQELYDWFMEDVKTEDEASNVSPLRPVN